MLTCLLRPVVRTFHLIPVEASALVRLAPQAYPANTGPLPHSEPTEVTQRMIPLQGNSLVCWAATVLPLCKTLPGQIPRDTFTFLPLLWA